MREIYQERCICNDFLDRTSIAQDKKQELTSKIITVKIYAKIRNQKS